MRWLLSSALALCAAVLMSGCGGNNTYSPEHIGGGTPGFVLSVAPLSATTTQGLSADFTITVRSENGFSSPVSLAISGLPAGAQGAFSPNSVTPTANGVTSALTITTSEGTGSLDGEIRSPSQRGARVGDAGTPPGSYTFTVTGTAGSLTRTATSQLVVQPAPSPSFTVQAGSSLTVFQGEEAAFQFQAQSANGFAGAVTFSAGGLPANAAAAFSPPSVSLSPNGTASASLQIQTSANTPAGAYSIKITGASGSLSNQGTETLIVKLSD